MFHECARNHRQKHKVFPSLFRRTHDTTKFFSNECASLRNNNTSTQTTFFLLSLFRRMLCFSFLRLVVCVKVAMYVFFVVFAPCYTTFSTTTVSQETFFSFWENRGSEKEFLWELWKKRHFSIDGFLLSCRRVVYFNPAEFCSLSQEESKKEKRKNRIKERKVNFRIHVFEGSCYIQFISFGSDSLGLISEVSRFSDDIFSFSAIEIQTNKTKKKKI